MPTGGGIAELQCGLTENGHPERVQEEVVVRTTGRAALTEKTRSGWPLARMLVS